MGVVLNIYINKGMMTDNINNVLVKVKFFDRLHIVERMEFKIIDINELFGIKFL